MQANDTFQKVEISISCRSLRDADVFSKSDPQVIFKMRNSESGQWYETGKTEIIQNNLNPNFKRTFQIDFTFEQKQECHLEVQDNDGKGSFDHLGECFTTIGAIVGARNNTLILDLTDKKTQKKVGKSKIVLMADKLNECNDFIFTQWKGVKLMNTDGWFDKSDPFLRIKRARTDGTYTQVHETEYIKDNLNPVWKAFELPCSRLDSGDHNKPIKAECWDWEKSQKFQFIGEFQFTVQELINGKREFIMTNPKKKHPGSIQLIQFNYIQRPSFLEFIRGNTQLNLVLAVDFTASNGAVSTPQSLHFMNPNVMNAYQQAIVNVGEILLDYDFDKKVPCYGFGGVPRYPGLTFPNAQHCFPMSGNPQNSEAFGMAEIMNLYAYSLTHVSLSGPTYFNPILQETMKMAEACKAQGSQVYTIMLILTDGEIHDMNETIDSLVYASNLPLSVIIVGIGNADFANMDRLDGDQGALTNSRGQRSSRDLVQFVPFRNFKGNGVALSKEVLAEVPNQLVTYMINSGIKPQPAPALNQSQVGMNQSQQAHQPVKQLAQGLNQFLAPHIQQSLQPPSAPPPPPQQYQEQYYPPPQMNQAPNNPPQYTDPSLNNNQNVKQQAIPQIQNQPDPNHQGPPITFTQSHYVQSPPPMIPEQHNQQPQQQQYPQFPQNQQQYPPPNQQPMHQSMNAGGQGNQQANHHMNYSMQPPKNQH